MGYQLWYSKNTGVKRNGTGFIDLKKMFTDTLTAKFISEELQCCKDSDDALHAKEKLESLEFDSAGVIDENGRKIGYVITKELAEGNIKKFIHEFNFSLIISDSTPLSEMINVFKDNDFVYVNYIDQVYGIVTKADLNKPPVRVYLFGVISLFEMHLTYWVAELFKENSWESVITNKRTESAKKIFESRKEDNMNQNITVIECLQLCDKRDILSTNTDFLKLIDLNDRDFISFMRDVESIRNNIAHSQSSIIDSIEFSVMNRVVAYCEEFLLRSDKAVMDSATTADLRAE